MSKEQHRGLARRLRLDGWLPLLIGLTWAALCTYAYTQGAFH